MSVEFDVGDVNARRAIDAPADAALLAITGAPASGKSETLARRYVALLARDPTLTVGATIVTAATAEGAQRLAARIDALLPAARGPERLRDGRYIGVGLDRLAFDLLAENATLTGLAYDLDAIDDSEAEAIFARASAPLFSAEWEAFIGPEIDAEVPGLRAPERFAVAVLRLIRKLRAARITPEAFLAMAKRGAVAFYATPPNLSAPPLIAATKDEYRSALTVDERELDRQRRRELDLAKIIAKLYSAYLDELVAHGCLTPLDALAEAARLLDEHPAVARACRRRFRLCVLDDAADLPSGEYGLLRAVFGETFAGVTIAGDPSAATQTFAGARPDRIFGAAATTLALQASYRLSAQIAAAAAAIRDPATATALPPGDAVRVARFETQADEARFVANSVAALVAGGTPPARIAVLHRSLRTLAPYEAALIEAGIAVAPIGDDALLDRHDTRDALALLWSAVDPFAHAWLLRALQLEPAALGDATLGVLCGEPANPQAALFTLPSDEPDGGRRWDRRRDVRLGINVVRGDRDADLPHAARTRLLAFRAARARWVQIAAAATPREAAHAILSDAGLFAPRDGEPAAQTRRRHTAAHALLDAIGTTARRRPDAALADVLAHLARVAEAEDGPVVRCGDDDAVTVAAIDHVKGRRFDHVYVVDVRAGSFPPYYVPDAFLFSPTYGMVPKENVGDVTLPGANARTAKFVWYSHHAKLREQFARESRRLLAVAMTRADVRVTVSAAGRPTRGAAAPELLVELAGLRPALRGADAPAPGAQPPAVDVTPPLAPPPPAAMVATIGVERACAMLRCVRCAVHAVDIPSPAFTLLSGRVGAGDRRVECRDVRYAFAIGERIVAGSVAAIVRERSKRYVAVVEGDPAAAAVAIAAFGAEVEGAAYFTEGADGSLAGPHALDGSALIARLAAVLAGGEVPLCDLHGDIRAQRTES